MQIATFADNAWYAIQTRPKQESRADANLRGLGVETFFPQAHMTPTAGGRALRIGPLFPRYLFVRCDVAAMAAKIRYTRGVARILSNALGPTPVDDAIVDAIRDRLADDGLVALDTAFAAGDHVRITAGPFSGFAGIFQNTMGPSDRVALLLTAVHAAVRVMVERAFVERAN